MKKSDEKIAEFQNFFSRFQVLEKKSGQVSGSGRSKKVRFRFQVSGREKVQVFRSSGQVSGRPGATLI